MGPISTRATRTLLCQATVATFLLALAGAGYAAQRLVVAKGDNNILPSEEILLYAIAHEMKYFEKEGLAVEFQLAQGSGMAAQLLQTGSAQVATVSPEITMKGRDQGGGIVAFYNLKTLSGYSIAVPPDSAIKSLADLKGKTIGVSTLGTSLLPPLTQDLSQLGLNRRTDYTVVAAGTGAPAATALATGKVDALGLWETAYASIENQGVTLRHIEVPILSKMPAYVLATTDDQLAKDRKSIEGYCRAVTKATVFAQANVDAAILLFKRAFPITQKAGDGAPEELQKTRRVFEAWLARARGGQRPGTQIGELYADQWVFAYDYYKSAGTIQGKSNVQQAYTNDLIKACNDFSVEEVRQQAIAFK